MRILHILRDYREDGYDGILFVVFIYSTNKGRENTL